MNNDFEFDIGGEEIPSSNVRNGSAKGAPDFYQITFPVDVNDEEAESNAVVEANHGFTDLVSENLLLQKELNRKSEELSVTRAYLSGSSSLSSEAFNDASSGIIRLDALSSSEYLRSGLLEVYNVPEFARRLVCDLKPRLAMKLPPCLPAYILFAAFRYLDRAGDDALLTNLFNAVYVILKDISTNSRDDFDMQALWLVNLWRLLNLLRQYSGNEADEHWIDKNSEQQNSWRLQHFNVEPIRNQLKLRVEDFYKNFMKNTVEPVLSPKIYPGILQHEAASLTVPSEKKPRAELSRESSKDIATQSLDDIKEFLNIVYTKLKAFGADNVVLEQVFGQITQWICALAMNLLVFRKDLCTFEKAIQIKHNVMEIKNWLNEHKLDATDALEPLIQASHLMQSRKDDSNLETLCGEMTSRLAPKQIISILQHYTPPAGFEEDTVDPNFIAKLSDRLYQRTALSDVNGATNNDSAIMPGTFLRSFDTQPFVYSPEDIQKLILPSCLKLDSVARLI